MKDIPMFTTENGAASLVLREIPVRATAYVTIQASHSPQALIAECVDFCRVCGAQTVYASGDGCDGVYPVYTILVEMCRETENLRQTDAALFPVTEQTVARWREICNKRMEQVPNAAYLTAWDERSVLEDGDAYFVHRGGELLGVGKASGETVELVASVKPGTGEDVMLALLSALSGQTARVVVAQENSRAISLYQKLGFTAVREVSRWYKIL